MKHNQSNRPRRIVLKCLHDVGFRDGGEHAGCHDRMSRARAQFSRVHYLCVVWGLALGFWGICLWDLGLGFVRGICLWDLDIFIDAI